MRLKGLSAKRRALLADVSHRCPKMSIGFGYSADHCQKIPLILAQFWQCWMTLVRNACFCPPPNPVSLQDAPQ
jgi:hypothetical protein